MFPLFGNLVGEEEFDPVNQILTNEIILPWLLFRLALSQGHIRQTICAS